MINRDILTDYFMKNRCSRSVCIIGYGADGEVCADCLRGIGTEAVVGVRPGPSWERASKAGYEVFFISDAVEMSDIVLITHPPDIFGAVFPRFVKPYLRAGQELWFTDAGCLELVSRGDFSCPEGVGIKCIENCIE